MFAWKGMIGKNYNVFEHFSLDLYGLFIYNGFQRWQVPDVPLIYTLRAFFIFIRCYLSTNAKFRDCILSAAAAGVLRKLNAELPKCRAEMGPSLHY
jgi:hypothetical protein